MRMIRKGLLLAMLLLPGIALAQTKPTVREAPPPTGAIWIGNSFFYFNNGITSHVAQFLAAAKQAPVRSTMVTMGGSGFDWHDVDSYFRPNAVGRYAFDAQNVIHFAAPGEKIFDTAVLMDCSQCPLHPELKDAFWEYGKRHAATVRAHGVRPVFFMSWAYADHPEMTAPLAEAYTALGNETGAQVIPAGLAFARALAQRPDTALYIADKRHPTLAGTYLAAAVSYATLFHASPVDLPYTAGLDPALAAFLQTVAAETVRDYLAP